MYIKCVYIVPVSGVDGELPMKQKKVTDVVRGMVHTNVYISFLLLEYLQIYL